MNWKKRFLPNGRDDINGMVGLGMMIGGLILFYLVTGINPLPYMSH